MMKKKMQDAFNQQINEELYSAYLYASMRAYFESLNLKGFSHWMSIQVQEEMIHARKFVQFIYDRCGRVQLKALKQPDWEWASPLAVFEAGYKHECHITECINKLATLALKEDDHAARVFLEWFVTEQVEEEANADAMVQNLKLAKDNASALFLLDREAGQRPAPAAAAPAGGAAPAP